MRADVRIGPCVVRQGSTNNREARTMFQLSRENPSQTIEVQTPAGVLSIALGVAPDGATVVFLDTPEWEPTADLLRVNVNDGPVFNYADAVNSYGDVS